MIKVLLGKNMITIEGHAGYADVGHDIVCAAASCIVQTCVRLALNKQIIEEKDYIEELDGVTINNISKDKELIFVTMEQLLKELSEQYPKYIQLFPIGKALDDAKGEYI